MEINFNIYRTRFKQTASLGHTEMLMQIKTLSWWYCYDELETKMLRKCVRGKNQGCQKL